MGWRRRRRRRRSHFSPRFFNADDDAPNGGGSEERKSCAAAKGKRKSHQPSFAVKGWRRFSSKQDVAIGANAKEGGKRESYIHHSLRSPSSSAGKEGRSCLWDDAKRREREGRKKA